MATNTAVSGSRTDVNNAINGGGGFTALNDADTCIIPADAGQNWTTGVAVTTAIKIIGAGSGRVIAYDDGAAAGVTLGTGTKTWTIAGYSPGFSSASITAGQTLRAFADNHIAYWLEGTVTSLSSGTLTMNITSTSSPITSTATITIASPGVVTWTGHGLTNSIGIVFSTTGALPTGITAGTIYYTKNVTADTFQLATGAHGVGSTVNTSGSQSGTHTASVNFHRWIFATSPLTTIINATTGATELFQITESTAGHVDLSGIQFAMTTRQAAHIKISYTSGGKAVLIHDCWFQLQQDLFENIELNTNRGVFWNCSVQGSSNNDAQLCTAAAIRIKDDPGTAISSAAWSSVSTFGTNDSTGESNLYIETSDFHCLQAITDMDSGSKFVFRYNLQDHAEVATHGADSANWGCRHGELYNNTGVYYGYNDGTTINMPNGWFGLVRGGTFAVHDNTWPAISSGDYGSGGDVVALVLNLHRNVGANACWGVNTSSGANYPAPRQVGMGYVTGTGVDGTGRTNDTYGYVGDTEPIYIWANSRSPLTISITNDSTNDCGAVTYDSSSNYIVANRDYFNGSTAKPSYTTYTYPHPLTVTTAAVINRQPITHRKIRVLHRR